MVRAGFLLGGDSHGWTNKREEVEVKKFGRTIPRFFPSQLSDSVSSIKQSKRLKRR